MNRRLDSWKAIADYLGRDAATARRWEKTLGLPVHRVAGGAGRSVFAYSDDIDAWLAASPTAANLPGPGTATPDAVASVPGAALVQPDGPSSVDAAPSRARRSFAARQAVAAVAVAALLGTAWWATSSRAATAPLRVVVTEHRVRATDDAGIEQWRYDFPAGTESVVTTFGRGAVVSSGPRQTVYVATAYRTRVPDGPVAGGELMSFDSAGKRLRTFSFNDEFPMNGTIYGAPWVLTDFAVPIPGSPPEIAVAAHHYTWSPSVVTILDRDWRRVGTWTHDGWIETLGWAGPRRLVAGGFDQARDAGLVALLDTAHMEPMRMVVMPRSEINLVTASRFNRAVIQMVNGIINVRTLEMPHELSQGGIDVIYEFTPSLDLVRASFSGRYWEMHRSLELEGKLHHSQETCPDRNGPREIFVWEPGTGWRSQPIAR